MYGVTSEQSLELLPIIESLEKIYDGVIFFKMNAEDNKEFCKDNSIFALPATIYYKNGKKFDSIVGFCYSGIKANLDQISF